MRKLKKALPWIALASALAAAGLLVGGSLFRRTPIVDTGETRAVVEKALEELIARRPQSLDDAGFKAAFSAFGGSGYVASAVLVEREGSSTMAGSGTVKVTSTVREADGSLADLGSGRRTLADLGSRAPREPDPLEGLSPDEFSDDQRLLLAVKSLIESRDADHNDVFGTLIRAVRNPAGDLLGAIGVRYERSFWVGARPGVVWILFVVGFALSFQLYWICVPAWTFLDARERGEKAWVWAAFTLVGNVIALVAYLLARAPRGKSGG